MLKLVLCVVAALMAGSAQAEMQLREFKNFTRLIPANVLRGKALWDSILFFLQTTYFYMTGDSEQSKQVEMCFIEEVLKYFAEVLLFVNKLFSTLLVVLLWIKTLW